ncbi:uncharacterized protein LOC127256258 [Andrographis paniculata]|uniref:uncharacterized protein LOC127256258 n=1 Tax=Andrographis paniculata TaxID=175694 RepID=UPI0021E7E978|nr:uncharacterized protein LOC127256258 [Andrographis paniculata]
MAVAAVLAAPTASFLSSFFSCSGGNNGISSSSFFFFGGDGSSNGGAGGGNVELCEKEGRSELYTEFPPPNRILCIIERMSAANDEKMSSTLVVNREQTKVLWADVNSDFVDILSSFFTLWLGRILGEFKKHYGDEAPAIGSLSNLYNSLASLDETYFWTKEGKEMLLNPRSTLLSHCRTLKFNLNDFPPVRYFACQSCRMVRTSISNENVKCNCGRSLNCDISVESEYSAVTDLLSKALLSQTPLTDLFVDDEKKQKMSYLGSTWKKLHIKPTQTNSKKIVVIAVVQKSTNKLLLVESESYFVDFLFSLLTVPMGGVAHLLGGSTGLGSIDNLHRA